MGDVLDFLAGLFDEGLGYSAINTACSAISAVSGSAIGAHPQVKRLVKGVFELRTPLPKYAHTWDVGVLLGYFKRQSNTNKELSLKMLSKKLVALLLLTTAQRVQTVHFVKVSCIEFQETGCIIRLVDKLKHTKAGYHQKPLKLPCCKEDERVCVVHICRNTCVEQKH